MSLPGFNAEASFRTSGRTYRGRCQYGNLSVGQRGLPALVLPSRLEALEELEAEDEMDLIDAWLEWLDEDMENDYEVETEEGQV